MSKKKKIVLHKECYTINSTSLTIDRYYQDKKGGGFRDRISGFKSLDELNEFVIKNERQ